MTDSRPVWLLDIDGVINAWTGGKPNTTIWPAKDWEQARIPTTTGTFPILAARPVLDLISEVHQSDRAEIRWHTTWQHEAQLVADAFGLPTLPVADAPEYKLWDLDRARGWWKLPAAERVLAEERRPLIWTDDDITNSLGRHAQYELRTLGPALLISPNVLTGLTPKHLERISDFLDIQAPIKEETSA